MSRLLHKHKFDEAERFARQFNLNVEVKDILCHKYDKISLVTFQFLSLSLANRTEQHAKKVVPDNPGGASGFCYWARKFCSLGEVFWGENSNYRKTVINPAQQNSIFFGL